MKSLYKYLIGLIVIVIIVYYFFFMQPIELPTGGEPITFEQGLGEMDTIWENHGISLSSVDFNNALPVMDLPESNLQSLRTQLSAYKQGLTAQTDDVRALNGLADVYVTGADVLINFKELTAAEENFDITFESDDAEICSKLQHLEEASTVMFTLERNLAILEQKWDNFQSAYPSQAAQTPLAGLELDPANFTKANAELSTQVNTLKTACAAEGFA
jgi:hypothetical protein